MQVLFDSLKRLKVARTLAFLTSALVATIRPKLLGVSASVISALGLSGVGFVLSKLIGMFYKYEFAHSENHKGLLIGTCLSFGLSGVG